MTVMTRELPPSSTGTRSAIVAYGLLAYASFHAVFLYLIAFLADAPVPYTVDGTARLSTGTALAVDLGLIALFGVQHTIMARPAFKRWWTRIIPEPMERSTFVFATVGVLAIIITNWSPIAGQVWRAEAPWLRTLLWGVQGMGWGTLVLSTFLIDHWELFGVRQVLAHHRGEPIPEKTFRSPFLYRFSRHPMMIGILIAFWATPNMTLGHLVFAAGFTVYVMMGVRIEERDLVATLGDEYRDYQERVPRFL